MVSSEELKRQGIEAMQKLAEQLDLTVGKEIFYDATEKCFTIIIDMNALVNKLVERAKKQVKNNVRQKLDVKGAVVNIGNRTFMAIRFEVRI